MPKVLIVESPNKAKHIRHFLGPEWIVVPSMGHIRDLPITGDEAYVRPPDFKLHYKVMDDKKTVVQNIKKAVQNAEVYLATDPDREGEAISWHICQVCGIPPKTAKRVTYHEVTEKAVQKAIENPRTIDFKLVEAQEARRALDRMVGWEVSGPLSRWVGERASAGRVQTPALRIIVEREQEIRRFKPTPYIVIYAVMDGWKMQWQDGCAEGEYFQDQEKADYIISKLNQHTPMQVTQAQSQKVQVGPPPPLITSTMQSVGSSRFKVGIPEIMKVAQSLFESGKITYHRTDDPNMGEEGVAMARAYLDSKGTPWHKEMRKWKAKEGAQEGHECIRPTDFSVEHLDESTLEGKLYRLIWERAIASQMENCIMRKNTVTATMDEEVFKATGSVVEYPGWKSLYIDEDEEPDDIAVPALKVGDTLTPEKGVLEHKMTQAPKRFTESTLVSTLEKNGVGRPSTYASIIQVLYARGYMKAQKQSLVPTPLAEKVIEALKPFDFADVGYTSVMEESLDLITQGEEDYVHVLEIAYEDIQKILNHNKDVVGGTPCPVEGCSGTIQRMRSKKEPNKYFWVCSTPDERHKFLPDDHGKPVWPIPQRETAKCPAPDCDGTVTRYSTKSGSFVWVCDKGKETHGFIADVQGKPVWTEKASGEQETTNIPCPQCKKPLVKRATKNGHFYLTCSANNKHGPWWFDEKTEGLGKAWRSK